jgi:hypothetical protein
MSTVEFKQSLRAVPVKEITDKIEYYSGFEPRGVNYQNMLDLYEAELERRFLAWEICEV